MTLRQPVNVRIRRDIMEQVRDKLESPLNQRTIKGSFQALVEQLLLTWLIEQSKKGTSK